MKNGLKREVVFGEMFSYMQTEKDIWKGSCWRLFGSNVLAIFMIVCVSICVSVCVCMCMCVCVQSMTSV